MRIPIRRWRDQRVLFEAEAADIREALVAAVGAGAHLSEADLRGADLREAYLVRANLLGAYLREADLVRANLFGAYLGGAHLSEADLRGTNLVRADLRRADLREADLREADLREADLCYANLRGADLRGATIPWGSREVIAEVLLHAAGDDVDKRMVAGLISISRDWCWLRFLKIEHSLKPWALDTLAACVVDGDGAPEAIADRARDLREQADS